MKKILFALCALAFAHTAVAQPVRVVRTAEEDGSPAVTVGTIKFPNGSVTDNLNGSVSVSFGSISATNAVANTSGAATNMTMFGSYGIVAGAMIERYVVANSAVTNLFYTHITNALVAVQSGDHVRLWGEQLVYANTYTDDSTAFTAKHGWLEGVTNVVIEGVGGARLYATNYGHLMTAQNVTNVTVRNIIFDGQRATSAISTNIVALFNRRKTNHGMTFENNQFINAPDQGISHCFTDLQRRTSGDKILNNTFRDIGVTNFIAFSQPDGAAVSGLFRDSIIANNYVSNSMYGFEFDGGSVTDTHQLTGQVLGNKINTYQWGISVRANGNTTTTNVNTIISGNEFNHPLANIYSDHAHVLLIDANNVIISDNLFNINTDATVASMGVYMSATAGNGNWNITIHGNRFYNGSIGVFQSSGTGPAYNLSVKNNSFIRNRADSIRLYSVQGGEIDNNEFIEGGTDSGYLWALYLLQSGSTVIDNLSIRGNRTLVTESTNRSSFLSFGALASYTPTNIVISHNIGSFKFPSGSPYLQVAAANVTAYVNETGTGNYVRATSPTITTPTISGAAVWPDNVTQTFNPGADNAGINVGSIAGDPATPDNGDVWYDSTANEFTARINGSNVALGAGGGGSVATDAIWDAAGDTVYGTGANTASRLAVGTAGQFYQVNAGATAPQWSTFSGDFTVATGGAATIAVNSVALGTDTTGNYALGDAEGGAASTVVTVDGTDATSFVAIFDAATGNQAAKTDAGLTYDATTGTLAATILSSSGSGVGDIQLRDTDASHYVSIKAPAIVGTNSISIWPGTNGTSAQVLSTANDGQMYWATLAGGGNVSNVGTPLDNQIGIWTGATTLEGDTAFTFDTSTDSLVIAASGNVLFGAVTVLDDNAGTMTLSAIDAIDATTETTLEAAIDIAGEVTGTGLGSVTLAETGISLTSITVGALLGVDSIDATGAVDMDYGSADITDHTFVTDGTGTAEIVLPAGSIDGTEILNDTIVLATDTQGNYVATIADSGASEVTVANSGTENAGVTLALAAGITRDTEWDTEAEVQTAWGSVNVLLETEIDASSELRALMDDEVGTGALMFTRSGIWRNISMPAFSWQPSATNPPTASTNAITGENVHFQQPVWSFANTTAHTNGVTIAFDLPATWDASAVGDLSKFKFKFKWSTAATSGVVEWFVRGKYIADGGDPAAAWGTAVSITDTAAGTASRPSWSGATGYMTLSGTPAAGGLIVLQVYRTPDDTDDTLANTAELWSVDLGYTESSTEPTAW